MKKTERFCFKFKGANLEFLDIGNKKIEIRPIHKPKKAIFNKITPLG